MSDVILVVAGDSLFAKGVERAFRKEGLEVVLADEAETALVALEFEKPAAVVVENDLRDRPGSQLARDIRGRDEGNGIPLILLAGAMMPASELGPRVFSAGVTACIDATVDLSLLARALKMRLQGDADALGRLARGEFVPEPAAEQQESAAENSITELEEAAHGGTEAPVSDSDVPVEVDLSVPEMSMTQTSGGVADAPVVAAVSRPAPKVYAPAKPRSGSLGDLPFGELLSELFREHATGVLDLSREKVKKSLWLKEGIPTYAKSNAMGETLGAVLVKMGKINEAQRLTSMEVMQKEKRRHGDVLVEMGLIKPKDVATALQAQARAKVINCFAWDDGIYRFVPTDELPDDMPSLKMTFGALVAAGVKQRYDLPRLRKVLLPHIGETPRYQERHAAVLDELKIEGPEREIITAMRGRRSLAEVLALSDMDEDELHRLLVSAFFAGIMRFYPEGPVTMQIRMDREDFDGDGSADRINEPWKPEPSESPASADDEIDLGDPSPRAKAPEPDDDEEPPPPEPEAAAEPEPEPPPRRRAEAPPPVIAKEPEQDRTPPPETPRRPAARKLTEPEPDLGLGLDFEIDAGSGAAPAPAARSEPPPREEPPSRARPRNRFDEDPVPRQPEMSVTEGRGRPEETAAPIDPELGRKIDAALNRMLGQNFYERLNVAVEATESAIKAAYLRLAKEYHPDRLVTEGGPGVKDRADKLFALVSEAYHTINDAKKRKKYDDEVIHGGGTDEAATDEANAILSAESMFLKGERLLKAGNFQKAFDAFKEAVTLYPKESEYQACYGWTMFKVNHPGNEKKMAEGESVVKNAIKMNGRNDKAYLFLGNIAKLRNDMDAAKKAWEKALSLQPDNIEAQRELRVLEMRDPKNKGISGLFRGGKK